MEKVELRTLKDIPHFEGGTDLVIKVKNDIMAQCFKDYVSVWNGSGLEYSKNIKQEAIKWANDKKIYESFDHKESYWRWLFLNFFNISEDDLSQETKVMEEDLK